jgi:hypothetical protein
MAFVTELISEEDKQRIGFDELTEHMGWHPRPSSWTVDRETGNFLINVFWGSEDDRNGVAYWFVWNGSRIGIRAEWRTSNESDGLVYSWRMTAMSVLPLELDSRREEIYASLQEAITSEKQGNTHFYKRIEFTML